MVIELNASVHKLGVCLGSAPLAKPPYVTQHSHSQMLYKVSGILT
jgi:hypothetical protein